MSIKGVISKCRWQIPGCYHFVTYRGLGINFLRVRRFTIYRCHDKAGRINYRSRSLPFSRDSPYSKVGYRTGAPAGAVYLPEDQYISALKSTPVMKKLLFPVLLVLTLPLFAQMDLPPDFLSRLDSMDIRFNEPLDSDFRETTLRNDNRWLEDHYAMSSRREKLEVRFHLLPEHPDDRYYGLPHLAATTLAMNLGSNDEDAVTAVHSFEGEELAVLGADWARMYTFRPKRSFSNKEQAQMIAVYREGRGLAYTILLFDRAPATLAGRQLSLRFR